MAISFTCVFCDKRYQVRNDQAGREMRCGGCGASLTVPEDDVFKTTGPARDVVSRETPVPRNAAAGASSDENWQWLERPDSRERGASSRTESEAKTSGGLGRVIAVVVLLMSILLPLSKLMVQQMRRGQRRPAGPAVQHPFAAQHDWKNWHSFTSEAGDFSIDAPEVMTVSAETPPYAAREYKWNNPVMEGSVTVVELTPSIATDIPATTVYSLFQNAIVDAEDLHARRGNSRFTQKTTPDYHEFSTERGIRKFRCRMVISGPTMYILKLGYRDPVMPVEGRMFDRYFDSFIINKPGAIPVDEHPLTPYGDRARTFETTLSKQIPAPQDWTVQVAPQGVEVVRYRSDEFDLPAWLAVPPGAGENDKRPAFVYLHGGNAFDKLDFEFCEPALDAGFVVLVPIFRGENGHSGNYEALHGEADDAAAAVRWLSEHEAVDAEKIYVFGHDFGGGLAGLLSLRDDVPIRHTGSCGGLHHDFSFYVWALGDTLPFPLADKNERDMRLLISNLADMQRPHLAYIGNDDYNQLFLPTVRRRVREIQAERPEWQSPLKIENVPGDHISSLDESIRRYVEFMKSDTGQPTKPPLVDPKKETLNL